MELLGWGAVTSAITILIRAQGMNNKARISVTARSIIFLALMLGLSGVAAGVGHWLIRGGYAAAGQATVIFMMSSPGIAGIICAILFERGRRLDALGFAFRPNWWWLLSYVGGIGFSGIALAVNVFIGRSPIHSPHNLPQFALAFLLINPLVQTILATLEEELGWRGYLYGLWRKAGFWKCSLGTGLIWGVWHAPGIILFEANYPEHPLIGAAAFIPLCMLIAPLVTLARDQGRSVIAAGICHGTINATDIASTVMVRSKSPLWQGDGGVGGFVAGAVLVIAIAVFRVHTGRRPPNASAVPKI
jgi:uncharacterized protein